MRSEKSVREKLAAARILRTDMNAGNGMMLGSVYIEGVIDILQWMLGNKTDLPLREHDLMPPDEAKP